MPLDEGGGDGFDLIEIDGRACGDPQALLLGAGVDVFRQTSGRFSGEPAGVIDTDFAGVADRPLATPAMGPVAITPTLMAARPNNLVQPANFSIGDFLTLDAGIPAGGFI
jgi:hypothetical protein